MTVSNLKMDISGWEAGLAKLVDPGLRVSLARSMGVAGGTVLRDEAELRAPQGPTRNLRRAIYLAFQEARSNEQQATYAVTWNKSKAPHGHLIEFGHWQTHATYKGKDGNWYSDPTRPLASPKWIAAVPFLRPAFDASAGRARQAMIERGRVRLPELLAGGAL